MSSPNPYFSLPAIFSDIDPVKAAIDELRFDFTDLDQRKPHNAEQTPADMSGPDLQPIKKKKKGGRPKKDSTGKNTKRFFI